MSKGRFTLGVICGSIVFFLLTGVQFARQKAEQQQVNRVANQEKEKAPKKIHSPLIRVLSKIVEKADQLDGNDKDSALEILRKADPMLRKIKDENRRALQRINKPVRIRGRAPQKENKAVESRTAI